MDRKGYELIKRVLEPNLEARWRGRAITVTPEPTPGEDYRFVTITTSPDMPPEAVLNALHYALLLTPADERRESAIRDGVLPAEAPELQPLAMQPGSITFEDHNRVVDSPLYY